METRFDPIGLGAAQAILGGNDGEVVLPVEGDKAEAREQSQTAARTAAARADFRALLDLMRHTISGVVEMIVERHGLEVQAILVDELIEWLRAMKERTTGATSRQLRLIDDVEAEAAATDFATEKTGEYPPLGPSDAALDDKPSGDE